MNSLPTTETEFDSNLNRLDSLLQGLGVQPETRAGDIVGGVFGAIDANNGIEFGVNKSTGKTYIQSRSFVADTSGWRITQDGSAEFQNVKVVGTISGRSTATIAAAINASGNLINDLINVRLDTSAKTILGDFTFGESGAIKMITDVNNGLWLSPTGILGKKAGVNTFAINTTGEITAFVLNVGTINASTVTISNLTVGTNVGLGTAQDSAGVTTIIGNTVTTGFVNALSVVAGSVAAENITGTIITGKTIRSAASGNNRLEITKGGYATYLTWWNAANNLQSYIVDDFSGHLIIQSPTFVQIGPLLSVQGNIGVTGTVDGVDVWAHATNVNAHHAQTHTHASHTSIGASDHHSSTSNALAITPASVVTSGNITAGGILIGDDCVPTTQDTGQVGYGDRHWDYVRANYLLYDISHGEFQEHDDIQLIKDIKVKDGKWDRDSFPKEVFKDEMYNLADVNGLIIGTLKQLIDKVEKIEAKIQ